MTKDLKIRKTVFILGMAMFVVATAFMSCKPATQEEIEAKENVKEANEEYIEPKKAATAEEWEAFKNSGDSIINKNNERIAELKLKMKNTGESIDAKYEKNIEVLEQKNKDLKSKMETYKNDANADWQSFKREINHDINEVGEAFKNLTVNNKN